jgi:hypothetical protein
MKKDELGVVAHTCKHSTQEAEARRIVSSKSVLVIKSSRIGWTT